MKNALLTLFIFLLPAAGFAQSLPGTDHERLRFLADSFAQVSATQKAEAIAWALVNNRPIRTVGPDGTEIEIMRIENGYPVYYTTDNDNAALSTNTNDLWNGSSLGLNLEGQSMFIGEWDGGAVRATHQEFNAGAGSRVTQGDSPSSTSWHATHVAGTLMAEGDVASAQGMAPQADLHAYDWNSDNSEMSTEASGGLLISNHSYGTICGWYFDSPDWYWYGDPSVSSTEDYNFGSYNSDARAWDLIAEAAPYYLICQSAGNDRNDDHNGTHQVWSGGSWTSSSASRDPDGGSDGYDCIGPAGTAKNILTVAAVNDVTPGYTQPSDVGMSSFSGWGPTDDGRIKPDISGNGVGLYSCDSDNDSDYINSSGTSMSSPNVAGSLILLQQYYNNLNGSYMRSSTLKALVIHTANEAGSADGPDYEFGWGLLDASGAAEAISNTTENTILEPTLTNGNTWSLTFTSNGIDPFSATMAWIDPAGTAQGAVLNPTTARLVNDLDIRISDGGAGVWFPWTLDPANPSNAAATGDNFRDNVEKLEPGVLPAGTYTLFVTHKGTLSGGSQPFSVIVTGVPSVPIADFTASSTSICSGETVTFTNASSGSPTSYLWSVSPSSGWSFVNGTNASSVSPQIQFTSSGSFTISLTATNSLGSDSEVKSNYISIGGLTLPFSEDFESSTSQDRWTIENPDGSTTWTFQSVSGNGGSTAAGIDNYNYSAANVDVVQDHLISPVLSFAGLSSVSFSFEYAYRRFTSNYRDSLSVWISADCGVTWTRLASYDENGSGNFATGTDVASQFVPSSASDWCDGSNSPSCPSFDLSAYAGQTGIQIRFTNLSGWGNDMFIDNINITGTSSSPLSLSVGGAGESCPGEIDGTAFVSPSGGVPPYVYLWSIGTTSSAITGLSSGTYSVTVNDSNGSSATGSYTVNAASPISLSSTLVNPTTPSSNDGQIGVTASGGTGSYTFNWSNGASGGFSVDFSNLAGLDEGTYSVTVTSGGCTETGSFTLEAPLSVFTVPSDNNICPEDSTGTILVSPSGGTAPYIVQWSDGTTTYSRNLLPAGSYTLSVTDQDGSSYSETFNIGGVSDWSVSSTIQNESAPGQSDGTVGISVSGGTPTYTYLWSIGANTSSINGLSSGTYTVTITDGNGCTISETYIVSADATPLILQTLTIDPTCTTSFDAQILLTVSGGQMPYTYLWSDGVATEDRTANLFGLQYSITVTDQVGQTAQAGFTLTYPSPLSITSVVANENISGNNDGSISVTPSGGTPSYTYQWSHGPVTSSVTGLAPGNYTVSVTDGNGCTISETYIVSAAATPLILQTLTIDPTCTTSFDAQILLTVSGGQMPYTYLWSDGVATEDRTANLFGLQYSITVTDQVGQTAQAGFTLTYPSPLSITSVVANENISGNNDGSISVTPSGGTPSYTYQWSHGPVTSSVTGLAPGNYTVSVTDANGCLTAQVYTISAGLNPVTLSGSTTEVTCNGAATGSIDISVSGGQPPYSYAWSNGANIEDLLGLSAGSYSVTVTGQLGSSAVATFTIDEPMALAGGIDSFTDASIFGAADGTATASASGGSMPYTYTWDDGASGSNRFGLSAGSYSVTIQDICGAQVVATVTIGQPQDLVISLQSIIHVSCFGESTGSLLVNPAGGTPPITLLWSSGSQTALADLLPAGSYSVTVSDAAGDVAIGSWNITQPSALAVSVSATHESIAGASDGTASSTVSGGTPPYTFAWSNGETTASISGLGPGSYTVTVTDASGCSANGSGSVGAGASLLVVSGNTTHNLCFGGNQGAIDLTVSGGQAPIVTLWNDGVQTEDRIGLSSGPYYITVSDGAGQTAFLSFTISEPSQLMPATSSTDETQAGASDGTASSTVSGGTPPYTFAWSNGETTAAVANLAAGQYSLTLTDANGCNARESVTIAAGPSPLVLTMGMTEITCFGDIGTASVSVSGGTPPYSYLWSTGETTATTDAPLVAQYSVTVTDALGWSEQGDVIVTGAEFPTQVIVDLTDTCLSTITLQVIGGAAPYQFDWIDLNDPSNNPTGPTIALQNACADAVCLSAACVITDANGCVFEIDTIEFIGCLSEIVEVVVDASVYPNPGTRSVTIESSLPMGDLVVTNTLGELVYSASEAGIEQTRIYTEHWPNGTYFIHATIGDRPWTYRWIKTD